MEVKNLWSSKDDNEFLRRSDIEYYMGFCGCIGKNMNFYLFNLKN